jgi:uncharacterized membrane protein YvbJ
MLAEKLFLQKGAAKMNCPKCGNGLPDGHMYCSKCGNKFEEKKEEPKKTTDEQHVSILLAMFLVVCLIVFLLYGRFPVPL